ncbi:MAG: hypothetical protein K1000chlam2_01076 [Chlamydiae bacterium]|nr:hypothetical protein [Chlamydiota bacterium]
MLNLKIFNHSLLLVTTPSLLAYPQDTPPQVQTVHSRKLKKNFRKQERYHLVTYDEILNLLDEIESGKAEKKYRSKDQIRINHYLAYLAEEGRLPNCDQTLTLQEDIEDLLSNDDYEYGFALGDGDEYSIFLAVSHGEEDVLLCTNWCSRKWKKTRRFVKNHKKEIIIGAAIVVATAAIVIVVVAASSTGAAAVAAGAAASQFQTKKQESSPAHIELTDVPIFQAELDNQVSSFKETIVNEQFFQNSDFSLQHEALSWEETGRVLGPLFAHESIKEFQSKLPTNPQLAQEVQKAKFDNNISIESGKVQLGFRHQEIDRMFSSDYSPFFTNPSKETDFNAISYHMQGEKALNFGYYDQAVYDLGKAIELDPTSSLAYLDRSDAYFRLGEYDLSLEDYHQYTAQSPENHSLSIPEFSLGFAKGLPKGIYESGEGILLLLSDLVIHPIHTGEQMWEALTLLSDLARTAEWGVLGEALAPEVHQLITKWDTIPSNERGELAGYVFGKYGADILIPGAVAKAAARGMKGAQELSTVYRSLKTAERTLVLESVAGLESSAKIAEVVRLEKKISEWLGDSTRLIRNQAEDPIFLSKDGLRKVRFDFNRPTPHESPHLHFEYFVDGEWQEISRIYPSDIPHK